MSKLREEASPSKKELREFHTINKMRESLNLPLLIKGNTRCLGGCGNYFFSLDVKGNRICENCKSKHNINMTQDYADTFTIVEV